MSRPFDLGALVAQRQNERHQLYRRHINPRFVQVLRAIGFDRHYQRGEGAWLWDREGNRYLDFLSGYGMFNIGRNHPVVKKAVRDYLDLDDPWKIQMGATVLPGLLAERLLQLAPHLDKVLFTSSGTESVEAALKFARCSTGREKVVYFENAFHGLTCGSLSLNGCASFREGFLSLLPGPVAVPWDDLDALRRELRDSPAAAVILEPVQGKGVNLPSPGFLSGVQELCRSSGALMIADEIQTGLGRTGRMFAYQHVPGLEPDMVLVAKSLSGGMVPAGAVLMRDADHRKVFSRMDRSVVHSSTFGQGGLAMACGLATLHVLEEEGLAENARLRGEELLRGLQRLAERFELCRQARGQGLMLALELGAPRSLALRSAWAMLHAADGGLFPQAIVMPLLDRHRILTQVAGHHLDVIKFLPPLVLGREDSERFLAALEEVLEECHRFPGPAWTTVRRLIGHALSQKTA